MPAALAVTAVASALVAIAVALVAIPVALVVILPSLSSTAVLTAVKLALTSAATAVVPDVKVFGTVKLPAKAALLAVVRSAIKMVEFNSDLFTIYTLI
jgi:hypothetical protein